MKSPSQADLLGYLLGALEPSESQQVQGLLDRNPGLEDELMELRSSLAPLELLDEPVGPPPGLARRACQAIASSQRLMPSEEVFVESSADAGDSRFTPAWGELHADSGSGWSAGGWSLGGRGGWSITDLLVACTAAAIVGAILLPAISLSRFNSRVNACQSNLQCLYHAMTSYAEMNKGEFIKIPDSGALSVAGCFGPILKEAGLLESDSLLSCAGLGADADPVMIPTLDEINSATSIRETLALQRRMGGNYGYALGHADNGIYRAPRSMGRANYALLSDTPTTSNGYTRSSRNHGSSGQNILFEGGRVAFVTSPMIGTDEVFLNDLRMVAPGVHSADSVVAPSYIHPIKLVWQ